jgi:GTP:adenosylcobinamide-phosphate guanylyltransferase
LALLLAPLTLAKEGHEMQLDAIVLAGGDPARDATLLAFAGDVPLKTLIKLGDQTFLERIVSALQGSGRVRRIAVVGLPVEHQIALGPGVLYAPDRGSILSNGEAGLDVLRATGEISEHILVSTADIPLVVPQSICDVIDLCLPYSADFCYPIVSKQTMERTYPGSGRTFIPIEGDRFAGGDILLVRPSILDGDRDRLADIIGERKTFWKQVRIVGLDTLFLFLVRRLTIAKVERRVELVLGFKGKAVICPRAEVAMDVDKPHHLNIVRAAWARGERGARA